MPATIVLFDIGNTSIKVGLATPERVMDSYTLRTDAGQTADSLGLTLLTLMRHAGLGRGDIAACIASSVVPALEPLLTEACQRFLACGLRWVPRDIPVPLHNAYLHPAEVGADRLVGAFAARHYCPNAQSLISVDFGTATTFDCISGKGAGAQYLGGLIFPGVHTATAALFMNAAKLPRVNLEVNDSAPIVGRDTATSINHGIIFGFASMVEGLSARLRAQLPGPVEIIATGGFAPAIARVSTCFDHVLPSLLLDGLRQLYVYDTQKNFFPHGDSC
ncbi:MAG: type III pantothenate kinase [Desulfovibrionaceae bacterium]